MTLKSTNDCLKLTISGQLKCMSTVDLSRELDTGSAPDSEAGKPAVHTVILQRWWHARAFIGPKKSFFIG